MTFKLNEKSVAIVLIVIGIIVAIIVAPKNKYFLPNFAYYWLPQAIIIGALLLSKMRMSVIGGSSLIMTIHLSGYAVLMLLTKEPSAAMAWVVYLFTIPGALVGALLFGFITKKYNCQSSLLIGTGSAVSTLIGIGIIQLGFCCTVMYCGFKC